MNVTVDDLLRHDRSGPRYTSYPPVPAWTRDPDPDLLREGVAAGAGPLSLYAHVPFCRERCAYCGCNVVIARRQDAGEGLVDRLIRQAEQVAAWRQAPAAERIHIGGGTPTWLSPAQLSRLWSGLEGAFPLTTCGVRSLEADPEATTPAHLDALAAAGLHRLSFGVQSLDPDVMQAIGRVQDPARLRALVSGARARGVQRVHLDLMVGLPRQTEASIDRTLLAVEAMLPDRLAVFAYAHLPGRLPHQRALEAHGLPDAPSRAALILHTRRRLLDAGYVAVGFDHFAVPDDPLAIAAREGTLHRDFMGYTDRRAGPLVGLGPSAISELPDRFAQQEGHLARWNQAVDAGRMPIVRGVMLDADARARRDAILALTCRGEVALDEVACAQGLPQDALDGALPALHALAEEGLATVDGRRIRATELGGLLVRRLAQTLDATAAPVTYSRLV